MELRAYFQSAETRRAGILQPLADALNAASYVGRFVVNDENGPFILDQHTNIRLGVWPTYKADPFKLRIRLTHVFKVRADGSINAGLVVQRCDEVSEVYAKG